MYPLCELKFHIKFDRETKKKRQNAVSWREYVMPLLNGCVIASVMSLKAKKQLKPQPNGVGTMHKWREGSHFFT
jgi:hypothetical protein